MLKGYKSYIIAGLIAAVTVVRHLGLIDDSLYNALLGFLGAGGIAALRAGMK